MFSKRTVLTAALALIASSTAAADNFRKEWQWGGSNFGLEIEGKGSGSLNRDDRISIDGSATFKAKLFGQTKKASASMDGVYGGTKRMEAKLKIDGVTLSSKDKTFKAQVSYNLASKDLFKVSKQFVFWSVPVVVKADVSAGASIGYGYEISTNGSTNVERWANEYEVFGAVGAAGTVAVGPGTDLVGAGVYGSVNFGEVKLAAVRSTPYFGGRVTHELQVDASLGDFEMGVKGWVGDLEVSTAIFEIEGFRKNLKTVKL